MSAVDSSDTPRKPSMPQLVTSLYLVGLLERLGLGKRTSDFLSSGVSSPWAEGSLTPIVYTEAFGLDIDTLPMTRGLAIRIPAVSKARNLLVATIARLPLRAMNAAGVLADKDQPTFLYRTNTAVTPYERMAWTVDDLIFLGYSLWITERGTATEGRRSILNAQWCPPADWRIEAGQVLVKDVALADDEFILFNSPFEGLLTVGSSTLRGARDQEAAWVGRARNPIPLIELHQMDDSLSADEVAEFVTAWSTARRSQNGAIGYTPEGMEIRVHGTVSADLMVEGRNAVRTDVGSFLNIRAAMLDGTIGVDSLTYSTTEGERNAFYDIDLPFWTDTIEARLSMDDIVPRGMRVRFDKSDLNTPTPTGATVAD